MYTNILIYLYTHIKFVCTYNLTYAYMYNIICK